MSDVTRRAFLRRTGLIGGGLLAAPVLGACGGGTGGGQAVKSGAVTINFWTHDPGYVKTFTESAKRLSAAPGGAFDYTVKTTQADSEALVTKMVSQGAAGTGTPDMIGIVISVFPRVMTGGIGKQLLLDLDGVVAPMKDDLLRTAPYSIDGKLYALESDTCLSVLYYREDEFKKNDIPEDVGTWEELAEIGARLHKKTGQSLGTVATGDNTSITNVFLQLLLQRGGGYFDQSGNLTLDSPEAVEVLDFMAKGVASGFLLALPDPYGAPNTAALKNGKLIATVMPNWYNVYGLQTNVPEQKGKWRIRNLPKFAGGGHIASALGGTGFAVLKDKPNTAAATELLKQTYLTRDGQLLRFQQGGFLPTLKSLYQDQDFLGFEDEYLGGQRLFDVYTPASQDSPTFYQHATLNVLTEALGGPMLETLQGKKKPAEAIKEAVAAYTSKKGN
ncbi:multiple sugar transport system substrate-binding protein/arabinosaccharide transport system substrate-binding protein [Nonomuraea thailandensis]|uniref:Multiple sugar transport system substrate-binding protein/arabinosaccharide transport system substrate-binding protein n=1 Tax=Nonomuraea thailandensis TaxID=1188745 RepID=A0A9X2GF70_9ACTN|nr:ABC transporter substrate-binding protein [Nonomuraea thailandensis]MCP2356670.1 multiple sugar transport system substrate-binding protein/arabinosaccharide transport system substrate-binding protein [Nonomuraea thailandensis]